MCMEFYNRNTPVARKEHKCEYCGLPIHKGEKYSCESGKYDGDMFKRKLDLTCYNIMDDYCRENHENEFSWDEISDWLSDKYCYDCEHGQRNEDDCEHTYISRCPIVRKDFDKHN